MENKLYKLTDEQVYHLKDKYNDDEIESVSPLSKVGEVTEEQIEEAMEEYLGWLGEYDISTTENDIKLLLRSLLQPQPVNSEGKKTENLGKYVFTFLKQNYHFPVQRAEEKLLMELCDVVSCHVFQGNNFLATDTRKILIERAKANVGLVSSVNEKEAGEKECVHPWESVINESTSPRCMACNKRL